MDWGLIDIWCLVFVFDDQIKLVVDFFIFILGVNFLLKWRYNYCFIIREINFV